MEVHICLFGHSVIVLQLAAQGKLSGLLDRVKWKDRELKVVVRRDVLLKQQGINVLGCCECTEAMGLEDLWRKYILHSCSWKCFFYKQITMVTGCW